MTHADQRVAETLVGAPGLHLIGRVVPPGSRQVLLEGGVGQQEHPMPTSPPGTPEAPPPLQGIDSVLSQHFHFD